MKSEDGGDRQKHLLPSNANSAERALSLAVQFGNDLLPEDIKTLWRPQEAAARFLPLIAWGLHVDFWRDALPEQAKRDLIASSYEWHRVEGTFGAIRRICDAVFGKTQVEAWYEYGGEPYGFRVLTGGEPDGLSNLKDWEILLEAIWFAQALRDTLDRVEIRRIWEMTPHVGIAAYIKDSVEIGAADYEVPLVEWEYCGIGTYIRDEVVVSVCGRR